MSTAQLDDGDSNLFTRGHWVQEDYGSVPYKGTVSWANATGASKVARFIGTSINVHGGLQYTEGTANAALVIQFIIDGGAPSVYSPGPIPKSTDFVYVTYYQSPQLTFGEHVLTMINAANGDICLLDSFTVEAKGGTAQFLQSDGSPTPSVAPLPQTVVSRPSNSPAVTPSKDTLSPSPDPTSDVGISSVTVTITQPSIVVNINDSPTANSQSLPHPASHIESSSSSSSSTFSAGIYYPTDIDANEGTKNDPPIHTPIIIAIITSALVVLLLITILLTFLISKRRKKRNKSKIRNTHTNSKPRNTLRVQPYSGKGPVRVHQNGGDVDDVDDDYAQTVSHRNLISSSRSSLVSAGFQVDDERIGYGGWVQKRGDVFDNVQSPVDGTDSNLPPYSA